MISATEETPSAKETHVEGISAVLSTRDLPFRILDGMGLFQTANPFLAKFAPAVSAIQIR